MLLGQLLSIQEQAAPSPTYTALLVVDNASVLSATDTAIQGLLTELGYTTTTVEDSVASTSDSDGKSVVILSDPAAGSVGNTFQNISEPVVVCRSNIANNIEISNSASAGFSQVDINIVDNTHPITSTLSTGALTIYTTNDQITYAADADVGAGATILAERDTDATINCLFVYDSGDTLADSSSAAGKRVFTWITDSSFTNHTTAADDLFKRVIQWAAGEIS